MATAQVNTVSQAFQKQREDMQLCKDLMGGTQAMLRAGQRYIPQENGEEKESWQIRLNRTILFNIYKRTLRYLSGRIFGEPVVVKDDVDDERFQQFSENVDRSGNNLTIWSKKVFESGINDGVTFCLIDFSKVETRINEVGVLQYRRPDGEWADKTLAADRDNNWSPYFIHIEAERVLDARLDWKDGNPRIVHFRYIETVEIPNGKWGTATYDRIRAYYINDDEPGIVHWEIWESDAVSNTSIQGQSINSQLAKSNFHITEEGILSIGVIPVVAFMPGERRTPLTAEPALIDLAQLNKRHWQATSSQFELMEYVRRPPWFGKCLGDIDPDTGKTKIVFGAGKLCHSQNEAAQLMSIGIDASSVEAGRQELQDLEDRMAIYGLQLLQPKTASITATETLQDAEENNSTLKIWALLFQDFLENCMQMVAFWWNMPDGPSVVVNTDFANAVDVDMYLRLYQAQVISRDTFLNLCKSLGILPDDFSIEDEAAKLAQGTMINDLGVTSLAEKFRQGL